MITSSALQSFIEKHPASAELVTALAPLIAVREKLSMHLPRLTLPALENTPPMQGVPYFSFVPKLGFPMFVDDILREEAPAALAEAMYTAMPDKKAEIRAVLALLQGDKKIADRIVACGFCHNRRGWESVAAKHKLNKDITGLFAVHMACCAAKRAAISLEETLGQFASANTGDTGGIGDAEGTDCDTAQTDAPLVCLRREGSSADSPETPAKTPGETGVWNKNCCPVCGQKPCASILSGKEGKRLLHCSLCSFEWQFIRTQCPFCLHDSIENLPIFYDEETPYERADACTHCNHYILCIDMRQLTKDIPVETRLLGMLPLELAMQKNGFFPAGDAQ